MKETCGVCFWFLKQPDSETQGICRLNPPTPMGFYQQGFAPNVNIVTQVSYVPVQIEGIVCSHFKRKGGKK